jgi:rod shape determining protein RodA
VIVTARARPYRGDRIAMWRQLDPIVVVSSLAITVLGVIVVFSATRGTGANGVAARTSFLERQALFAIGGVGLMAIVMCVDFRRLREVLPLLYGSLLAGLALVCVAGVKVNGARAWFKLASFQLQPSEFGKLILIVALAVYFGGNRGTPSFRRVTLGLALAAVPMGLIMLQPDLGTVLVYAAIVVGVLIVVGTRPRHLLALALVVAIGLAAAVNVGAMDTYQRNRLTAFVDKNPNKDNKAAFEHQKNAQIAIGNGGLFGEGLFNGMQNRSANVPEQQTDFIFTVVGEELGFVGSTALLVLYGLLIWRIWRIAALAHEFTGTLLCVGVLSMLLFQVFESTGMTMGIMPITGIPLPFVSYGGSSILTSFLAVGLVESVHMRRFA